MSNAPMPGMLGGQQPLHPSIEVFKNFLNGNATKQDAVNAFADYIMTGMRGIPVPNMDLAKSVLLSDSSHTFMGYPQVIQCMALIIKNS